MQKDRSITVLSPGTCPQCGSWHIGLIRPGDVRIAKRQMQAYYKRHRNLLWVADPGSFDKDCSANRFCWTCKYQWREEEKRPTYLPLTFSNQQAYQDFLSETEFDFDSLEKKIPKEELSWKQRLWGKIRQRFFV